MPNDSKLIGLLSLFLVSALLVSSCKRPGVQQQIPPLIGLADYHNHQFAYLGFGGTAISHSIDPSTPCIALPSFDKDSLRVRDVVRQNLFESAFNQFAAGNCAPMIGSAASQRVDTDNLWRAWQYGLRLIVVMAVSSEFLCEVGQLASPCPSDRVAIEQQIQAAKDLQAKIDAASGGPGRGWYRIVMSPTEARQVISDGKLAVVLGIEAANAFGCGINPWHQISGIKILPSDIGAPEDTYVNDCDKGLIGDLALRLVPLLGGAEELKTYGSQSTHKALALFEHYWRLGVRHFYLTHNIDGLASGTALSIDLLHADTNPSGSGVPDVDRVIRAIRPKVSSANCGARIPYDGGRCNARGLEEVGRDLARMMAAHGAIIDADHISLKAKNEILANDGPLGGVYPLISSHSGIAGLGLGNENNEGLLSDNHIESIVRAGGAFAPRLPAVTKALPSDDASFPDGTYPKDSTIAPHSCAGTSESFVQAYRYFVDKLRGELQPDGSVKGGKLLNGKPAFVGVGIGTDFGPPIPVFSAPRFRGPANVTAVSVGTPSGRGDLLRALSTLVSGSRPQSLGACHSPGSKPMVSYPFRSPMAPELEFFKSATPWDGRVSQPGYDISFEGVVHIGMLPDFVEEMRVLGVDLQPLWYGAEAYIRGWENADSWKASFDREGSKGVRANCEQYRATLLQGEDNKDSDVVVSAMKNLRSAGCRGIP